MADAKPTSRNPWAWIPTLYVAEGLPNALVATVSVVLYNDLGVSNAATAFYTSLLYLPWVIKPLWSPVVDILKTRRQWIWAMQLLLGAVLAGVALMIPAPHFIQWTIVFFGLLAFSSATHDIAADGFYMLAPTEREQSFFIGFRSVFFNVGKISAQGGLVYFAGELIKRTGNHACWRGPPCSRSPREFFSAWHFIIVSFCRIRRLTDAGQIRRVGKFLRRIFQDVCGIFSETKNHRAAAFFAALPAGRGAIGENHPDFSCTRRRRKAGWDWTIEKISVIYGTAGVIAFMCGALLGGFLVARHGLKFWLWPMLLAIHLPDAVFIWLAYAQPENLFAIGAGVAVEQFGYGFGFTALLLYMIYIARGEHQTAHYAICTGFMALGMMLPGMWSGWLQERLGYPHFFVWVILATIPSFIVAMKIPLDAEFGKRTRAN